MSAWAVGQVRMNAETPTTYTIYGGNSDGQVIAPPGADDGDGSASLGLVLGVGEWDGTAYESFIEFDTSSVEGTITSVTLSLVLYDTPGGSDTIEVRAHDWGPTLTGESWLSRATLGTKTLVASRSIDSLSPTGYNAFTSEAAFLAAINQNGMTRLVLNSAGHRLGLGLNAFANFRSADNAGTDVDPKLVVEALV